MIIRITRKLGDKIGIAPAQSLPADPNPLADWTSCLFTADRAQYILVSNTFCMYSVVMYGRGITDANAFLDHMGSMMREFMRHEDCLAEFERLIAPSMKDVSWSKSLNRTVTGSMNDMVFQAKVHLTEGQVSPHEASLILNDNLLTYLDYIKPRDAIKAMALKPTRWKEDFLREREEKKRIALQRRREHNLE